MAVTRYRRLPDPMGGTILPESNLVWAVQYPGNTPTFWAFTRKFEDAFNAEYGPPDQTASTRSSGGDVGPSPAPSPGGDVSPAPVPTPVPSQPSPGPVFAFMPMHQSTLEAFLRETDAHFKKAGYVDYTPTMRDTIRLFLEFARTGDLPTKTVTVLGRRVLMNRAVIGAKAARTSGKISAEQFVSRLLG